MSPPSREILEKLNEHCYQQKNLYRFNKTSLQVSDRYRKGRLAAIEYLDELTYFLIKEEKKLPDTFREHILWQMQHCVFLKESDYKQGLYDALNDVLDQLSRKV